MELKRDIIRIASVDNPQAPKVKALSIAPGNVPHQAKAADHDNPIPTIESRNKSSSIKNYQDTASPKKMRTRDLYKNDWGY